MFQRIRSCRSLLAGAALACLALAPLAGAARAEEGDPIVEDGPKTVAKYVTCAGSLALAPNLYAAFSAFMLCAKMFLDEPR